MDCTTGSSSSSVRVMSFIHVQVVGFSCFKSLQGACINCFTWTRIELAKTSESNVLRAFSPCFNAFIHALWNTSTGCVPWPFLTLVGVLLLLLLGTKGTIVDRFKRIVKNFFWGTRKSKNRKNEESPPSSRDWSSLSRATIAFRTSNGYVLYIVV